MTQRRPDLQTVINRAIALGLRDVYTWIPAKVVKYDADKQRADCQILIKNVTTSEGDEREVNSWPVIPGVPVEFPGDGDYCLTFPISDGTQRAATTGSLAFSHRSLDKWLSGTGGEVDPEHDHEHALTDAKFFPGLRPFGNPLSSAPTDHMTIGHNTGKRIHLRDSTIIAGTEAAAQFVALANLVNARLDAIQATYDAHKHTETGGTTSVPDVLIGSLASVAATVLKGE
jgi:hypothetical protein